MKKPLPDCQICDSGKLQLKKKRRMSGPVVFIGYIFLIPSMIGILMGLMLVFGTGAVAVEETAANKEQLQSSLIEGGIPEELVNKALANEALSDLENNRLTDDQKTALEAAKTEYTASQLGAGAATVMAGGMSIFIIVCSFVGGLLGWLLVMKKKVLQCTSCKAIVAAS